MSSEMQTETLLPAAILEKADFRSNEYAWRIADIPAVIKAAADANLLSLGGQLQIRTPDCIGECDWVETDPAGLVPDDLPWDVRVAMCSELALQDWKDLLAHFDVHQQIREAFPDPIKRHLARGGTVEDATWFVWYVMDEAGDQKMRDERPDADPALEL